MPLAAQPVKIRPFFLALESDIIYLKIHLQICLWCKMKFCVLYIFTASLRRGFPELSLDLEGDCGDMQHLLGLP